MPVHFLTYVKNLIQEKDGIILRYVVNALTVSGIFIVI